MHAGSILYMWNYYTNIGLQTCAFSSDFGFCHSDGIMVGVWIYFAVVTNYYKLSGLEQYKFTL